MNNFFKSFSEIKKFNKISIDYKKIVFFSENNNYSYFFKSIIDRLVLEGIKITFVTADQNDFFLKYKNPNFKIVCISNFFLLQYFFSNLKCKNLILTMPDLGTGILNRSPFCEKYIYIFHSLISTNVAYKEKSFINYDIFFSPSTIHTSELQIKFKNSNKKILETGYPKIEELKKELINIKQLDNILIAPTWGSDSSLYSNKLTDIIQQLIKKKYHIIFRPHPMSFKKDQKKIKEILSKFKWYKKFELNDDKDNNKVILSAKVLITDWSGSAMEFSITKEKPSLFIDTQQRVRNSSIKKNDKILEKTFEYICRNKLGVILDDENIFKIEKILEDFYENENFYRKKILDFKKKFLYNYENSLDITISNITKLIN